MSNQTDDLFKNVISHAKEYGFVFQSSEIYDGLSAVYDYGQNGSELKNNIKTYWWKAMVQMNENIVGIDSAIFMHPTIWKASGHVDGFSDPMIDNKDSKKRYRADQLIEDKIEDYWNKAFSDLDDYFKRNEITFSSTEEIDLNFVKENFRNPEAGQTIVDIHSTNFSENVKRAYLFIADDINAKNALELFKSFTDALISEDLSKLRDIIIEQNIKCPVSGTANWTDVRQFNLMFSTQVGAIADESETIYLRPETAQGIFVNYLNVQKSGRMKIPFGIAQIGKAFRNEVIARQFIIRMREFEQMEMQFFVRPGTQREWFDKWKQTRLNWHLALGTAPEKYRYHEHTKLAHYADAAFDIEYNFPFGFKEVEGIHSRTDFDLSQHEKFSRKKMQYFDPEVDPETGKPYGNYIPYVIETSIGLDRMFLLTLINAYEEEDLSTEEKQDSRTVLRLHPALAPVKAAIFPLTKKDGLPEKAREIMDKLKLNFNLQYEEKDAIGKRYRRQDAIGTPFCITVDHQSLEDNTVTIRHRDTMAQERVNADDLDRIIGDLVSWKNVL
ncbi:glycine--tRNA ligase [Mucilaginibacter conchicola]|uniref:Glycine--tRNA ligase n=1 Tax=Mucilaginibacter conchicola TaxID=2303333 RepID=A0A372NQC8_9SPHI|nr:glycine--tRNA ligase [Mucilaginibacter conchicola]RFZ90837.1 glycine--tRNA ligase [Mucilaginibacter conchicola]